VENKISRTLRSLSKRADFENLRAAGHSFHVNSWLLVNMQATDLDHLRCGWTIPRQVGPAVLRNRFRRWGREFLRKWLRENPVACDVNFVFKRKEPGFYKGLNHEEFDGAFEKMAIQLTRRLK
jgi:ribonuclease P protein component